MWVILIKKKKIWDYLKTPILRVKRCVRFRKSYICSNKLDVQETNFSVTQFNRIRNHFCGCRIEVRWYSALDLLDLIASVLGSTTQHRIERRDPLLNKREACSPLHTIHKRKQSQRVINDFDQDDHKGKKPDNETCFQNPQSCS